MHNETYYLAVLVIIAAVVVWTLVEKHVFKRRSPDGTRAERDGAPFGDGDGD